MGKDTSLKINIENMDELAGLLDTATRKTAELGDALRAINSFRLNLAIEKGGE